MHARLRLGGVGRGAGGVSIVNRGHVKVTHMLISMLVIKATYIASHAVGANRPGGRSTTHGWAVNSFETAGQFAAPTLYTACARRSFSCTVSRSAGLGTMMAVTGDGDKLIRGATSARPSIACAMFVVAMGGCLVYGFCGEQQAHIGCCSWLWLWLGNMWPVGAFVVAAGS
jgi:hypothetical protein